MSYNINYKFWVATSEELKDVILREKVFQKLKPTQNANIAHEVFASLYAKYVSLVNSLSDIYDQTCQVQKRDLVRRLLESATKRLLELKAELKNIELSEFIYVDKTLIQQKLLPKNIQLLRPYHFPQRRPREIQDLIDGKIIKEPEVLPETFEGLSDDEVKRRKIRFKFASEELINELQIDPGKQKIKNAANLIKAHEKARKARLLYFNIKLYPESYKPKPPPLKEGVKYEFTHRPDHPMLIPVKKIKYGANFLVQKKNFDNVKYYVRPAHRQLRHSAAGHDHELAEILSAVNLSDIKILGEDDKFKKYKLKDITSRGDMNAGKWSSHSEILIAEDMKMFEEQKKAAIVMRNNDAAMKIQCYWKYYKLKKRVEARRIKKFILYGMIEEKKWKDNRNKELDDYREHQRNKKAEFDKKFIEAVEDEKARILKVKSPWIMEDISDHIRSWFREFYEKCKDFHPYPDEMKGGTILLLRDETMTPDEYKMFLKKQKASKQNAAAEKKEAEKKKKAEEEKLKAKKEKEALQVQMKKLQEKMGGKNYEFDGEKFITKNFLELDSVMNEYEREWCFIDEKNNINDAPYMDWITLDKYDEVYKELRVIVDELMRIEYELLKKALAKDNKKKYKPLKKQKPKKKGREKKAKRGKKEPKDITADRSIESLYYEMENSGLIKKYNKRNLNDYIGDYNYTAYELRNKFQLDPQPSKGEIKDILREWLPGMGPLNLPNPKSICIAGPELTGKKFLTEAIATELDAVIIDISPEIVVRYENDIKYFIHLVTKMAKKLQPAIFYINGAHRPFYKKVPKDEEHIKPKLLGKYLIKKIVKPIKKDEKIFLLGITNDPWLGKIGKMKKCYEKILLVPKTDYGTGYLLYKTIALSKNGVPRDFDFSAVSLVTQGYSSSVLYNNIESTLDIRRRIKLAIEPLKAEEFVEGLIKGPSPRFPIINELYNKYLKWYANVNKLAKKRTKLMEELEVQKQKQSKTKK